MSDREHARLCARAACTATAQHACARCGQAATCSEGCADAIWLAPSTLRPEHGHADWCAEVSAHDWWRVGAADRGTKRPRTDGGPDRPAGTATPPAPTPAATQARTELVASYLRYLDQLKSPYLFLRNLVQYLPSEDQAELLAQLRTSTARTAGGSASPRAEDRDDEDAGDRAPDADGRAQLYRATEELLTFYGNIYTMARVYESEASNYVRAPLTYSVAADGSYTLGRNWRTFARDLPTYSVHKVLGTDRVYAGDPTTRAAFTRVADSRADLTRFRDTVYVTDDTAGTPTLVNRPIVPLFVRMPSGGKALSGIFADNRVLSPVATSLPPTQDAGGEGGGARVVLTAARMQDVLRQWGASEGGARPPLAPWYAALERLRAYADRRTRSELHFPTPLHLWWALHANTQTEAADWITPRGAPPTDAVLPRHAAPIDRRVLIEAVKAGRERTRVIAAWTLGIGGNRRLLPLDDAYRTQSGLRDTTDLRALSFGLAADTAPARVAAYWEGAERVWRDLILPAWFHDAAAERALLGTGAAYLLVRPDNPRSDTRTNRTDEYLAYAADANADAPGFALERMPWTGFMIALPRDPPPGQRDFPPETPPHTMLAPVLVGGNALGELMMAHRQALRKQAGALPAPIATEQTLTVRALADAYAAGDADARDAMDV